MATSGTFSYTVSRNDLIIGALKNIGKLDPFDTPNPVDVQDCADKLNKICKQRMGSSDGAQGLKVWTRRHGHLFLSGTTGKYLVGPSAPGWTENYVTTTLSAGAAAGASSVTLVSVAGIVIGNNIGLETNGETLQWTTITNIVGLVVTLAAVTADVINMGAQVFVYAVTAQQPLKIETASLRDIDLNDVPVRIITTIQDYDLLPQKANPRNISDPTAIYYEFQLGNSSLFTDVGASADVTKHLVMSYLEPIQDFNNPLDNPEYPAEYQLALEWLLSEQVAPMFMKVWTPSMEKLKDEAVAIAFHKLPETTTMYFRPGED